MDVTQPGTNASGMADDEAGTDAGSHDDLDLTPRDVAPRRSRRKSVWGIVGGLVVVAAIAVVLWNGLSQATVFFYNVDQAVAKRTELGDKQFRMQGNVVKGTIQQHGAASAHDDMDFVLTYAGKQVPVRYSGEPSELFGPAIPVVLEGHFEGTTFVSDSMLIRHDNDYDQKNPTREKDAERDAQQQS